MTTAGTQISTALYPCPFPSFVITVALSRKHEPAQFRVNQQVGQRPGVDIGREIRMFLVGLVVWCGFVCFLLSGYQHTEEKEDGKHCHSHVEQVVHHHALLINRSTNYHKKLPLQGVFCSVGSVAFSVPARASLLVGLYQEQVV